MKRVESPTAMLEKIKIGGKEIAPIMQKTSFETARIRLKEKYGMTFKFSKIKDSQLFTIQRVN